METTIVNHFLQDDKITLILDRDIASFSTAADVQDAINSFLQPSLREPAYGIAHAKDQLHVEVTLPPAYSDKPVMFVKLVPTSNCLT